VGIGIFAYFCEK